MVNLILNVDSYKASHFLQYPEDTSYISSYIEARGGRYSHTVFFGLQMFLKEYLTKPITKSDILEAEDFFISHGGYFNKEGWEYIIDKYNGYLPVEIEAVSEGSVVPVQNVLLQIKNTDSSCSWLTSYLETALLRAIWYPTTVASLSFSCKAIIKRYLDLTSDIVTDLNFKLHDFGARGASSYETASIGGAAHLINFMGSDNAAGSMMIKKYYNEDKASFSIASAEHSTITCWGRDHEVEAYKNILDKFTGEGKKISIVSDSYDFWHSINNIWGGSLKNNVIENGGMIIIRPDSGDPVETTVETVERLMDIFNYRINKKGYKILPDFLRIIQGNNISKDMIETILSNMKARGQSADNVSFGMGGELLQSMTRDNMKFVMKASAVERNNIWHDIYKNPLTDRSKTSKKGRLALVKDKINNEYKTIALTQLKQQKNHLTKIFRNGEILVEYQFEEIRKRAREALENFM